MVSFCCRCAVVARILDGRCVLFVRTEALGRLLYCHIGIYFGEMRQNKDINSRRNIARVCTARICVLVLMSDKIQLEIIPRQMAV